MFIFSTIVIYLIVSLCLFLAKRDRKRSKLVANYHPLFLIIGGIGFVVFTVFEVFSALSSDVIACSIFMVLMLLSLSLVLAYCNCRVYIFDTYAVCQNFFRVRRKIQYDEIVSVKRENDRVFLRTPKRKMVISSYMVGRRELFKALKPYRNKIKNLNDIPTGKVPKVLKYKDAVNNYGEFVFANIMMSLLGIGCCVIAFFAYPNMEGVILFSGFAVMMFLVVVLMIQAAKRHHSSKLWAFAAKYLYKVGYLKDPYNFKKENPWSL